MKKYIISFVVFSFVLLGFAVLPVTTEITVSAQTISSQKGLTTMADLGVPNPGTLPTSRLYFLKEWRRGLTRLFTFNSIAKAELELNITNEKAAEALKVQKTVPDDAGALATALKNYTKAQERLQARIAKLEETSENPNVEKLLEKLDEQTLKHADLLNQLAAGAVNPEGTRDNYLQGAVDIAQKKIQETIITAAEKDKNIEQKATDQIARAETAVKELESALAEFAINDAGVPNEKTGPIRIDSTPARISTNMTIERQTPKRDFGDRMKAGLDMAGGMLANAKVAYAAGKYGEAFGQARSAEVLARNGLREMKVSIKKEGVEVACSLEAKICPDGSGVGRTGPNCEFALCPGEKKDGRVFPETNNRTTCDDRETKPACPRGEILDCNGGKWACIGPATGGGINVQTPGATTDQKQIEIKPTTEQASVAESSVVTYTDAGYSPATLRIKKGDTVTFKNQSSQSMWTASAVHPTHRAYPTTGGCLGSTFDACAGIQPGDSWSFKFDISGTWKYHDHLNPDNTGTIIVE